MSDYPNPPPSYQTDRPGAKRYGSTEEAAEPLLGSPRAGPSAGAIYDQPTDLPDDFKVSVDGIPMSERI